jgi:hypothetical protein
MLAMEKQEGEGRQQQQQQQGEEEAGLQADKLASTAPPPRAWRGCL